MIVSVHQPQYIPWLGYFDKIDKSDCFVFLDNVQYKHGEYQNRNKIRAKSGWIWLTVPVIYKGHTHQKIYEVKIDNALDWQKKHWGSLRSCYGKAACFKEYAPFLEKLYSPCSQWERLMDLNIQIIQYILKQLKIEKPLYYESEIGTTQEATERIIEICKKLNAETYLSGIGGKVYLEEEKFAQAGIKLEYQDFIHPCYQQQFADRNNPFLPYMSILDLLFNEGPESARILRGATPLCMKNIGG